MRTYAIGDIHGHLDKLRGAHDLIAADRDAYGETEAPIVHVGDLVDRGPDSAGVIDYLMKGQQSGENWIVLRGNHDRMFLGFLDDPYTEDPILSAEVSYLNPRVGGEATLESYGIPDAFSRPLDEVTSELSAIPQSHRDWLARQPAYFSRGEAIFVHAGIRPGVAIEDQVEDDLLWIRKPFLTDPRDHGALIVHGHTNIKAATHYGNRLNLDSGAGYGHPLSTVVIEGRDAWLLTPEGRAELPRG
ncbi:metallophosphoesterase family protein [Thioclava nitratireducens]|uniref:metallophosphoesterase family protein n=1 Tax=Thioclava nitratireducens TaxID=1915078 RepID=UPI0024803F48|nr:metallophosphoesterase family protein [Thioclava nitratireducens]WGT52181.1 metallophosphoesterase family protein [Thioclava nitratireducens]